MRIVGGVEIEDADVEGTSNLVQPNVFDARVVMLNAYLRGARSKKRDQPSTTVLRQVFHVEEIKHAIHVCLTCLSLEGNFDAFAGDCY